QMFIEGDDAETAFEPSQLLRPALREWRTVLRRAPRGAAGALRAALDGDLLAPRAAAWRALERSLLLLPNGLVDAAPAELRMAQLFSRKGRTNDFRCTAAPLRIVATDIDSGEPVAFGAPGHDHVPISRAAAASCAVPGLFAPVRIGGRRYL